jgi:hypothetical protein
MGDIASVAGPMFISRHRAPLIRKKPVPGREVYYLFTSASYSRLSIRRYRDERRG